MYSSRALVDVHIKYFDREKCDLSYWVCLIVVSARMADLSISQTADPLGFSHTIVSRVCAVLWEKMPCLIVSVVDDRCQKRLVGLV